MRGMADASISEFRIAIPDADLEDLQARLARTRWPDAECVDDWNQGIPLAYTRTLADYWANDYDWRAREAALNRFAQFTTAIDGHATLDLKLQGTAILVDVARLYALAHGIAATSTRERFETVGPLLGVPEHEHASWVAGFEFLQTLRLRAQLDGSTVGDNPNRISVSALNDIDRRILRETLRVVRSLQQRVQLDYQR